jgi:lysine/ornithine N-monooxygenase
MSARDELAGVIEAQPALLSTGSDQQDRARSIEIADAILAAGYRKLEPAWLGSLEHDDTHEFVNSSHCDGEHIARWRRTPEMELVVKAGPWEIVEPEPLS